MKKWFNRFLRLFKKIFFVFFLGLALLGLLFLSWRGVLQYYNVKQLVSHYPKVTFDAKSEKATYTLEKKRPPYWVTLGEVSKHAIRAIVISEDSAFFVHDGIDVEQLKLSLEKNLEKGRYVRGGSTITQQVIKNVFLTREKTLLRKATEIVLAFEMDAQLSKSKILEVYLNIAEWGSGIYGIKQASGFYFQKHPSQLTPKEGAFLAMLLPGPKKNSSSFRKKELTPYARKKINWILKQMHSVNYLSDEEYELNRATRLSFETDTSPEIIAQESESAQGELRLEDSNNTGDPGQLESEGEELVLPDP